MKQTLLRAMTDATDIYRKLLENLSTAVVLVDDSCRIDFLNQAAQAVLSISNSKAEGQDISYILSSNEFERRAILQAIRDRSPFTKRRTTIRNEHGKKTIIDFTLTPFDLELKTVFVVEIQEIDRLVRISKEESILATHDTTRQLIRGLAHEVKNPLGGIRGAAQLLQAELSNPELMEYTQVITEETDRLRNLVDTMLGPNQPLDLQPLNIHEVLDHVLTLVSAETNIDMNPGVRIVLDYDPSLPEVLGDRDQLIQAMLNIARNAIQALKESKTEKPTLLIQTRIHRRFTVGSINHALVARVDFEDNGPGISPEFISEIFYPMITGRSEGTGLGLTIAQSIIQNHKGLIECTSEPGRTEFSSYIPIA